MAIQQALIANMYISTVPSLVPRPLRDFISQPWRKIGRRPGIITTEMVDPVIVQSESTLPTLQDKIWEWTGDEAIMCHLPAPASIQQYFDY